MRKNFKTIPKIIFWWLSLPIIAFSQTGGQFAVTQSVVANGGASSANGNFTVIGTAGQSSAGTTSTGGNFSVTGGFWQAFFAPTAAQASVSGRVTTANGNGIRNARLTLVDQLGATRTALTGAFGYFTFPEIPVGEIYVLTVYSKRFTFGSATMVLNVNGEISDVIFVADWQ